MPPAALALLAEVRYTDLERERSRDVGSGASGADGDGAGGDRKRVQKKFRFSAEAVPTAGFEPATIRTSLGCSPTELRQRQSIGADVDHYPFKTRHLARAREDFGG